MKAFIVLSAVLAVAVARPQLLAAGLPFGGYAGLPALGYGGLVGGYGYGLPAYGAYGALPVAAAALPAAAVAVEVPEPVKLEVEIPDIAPAPGITYAVPEAGGNLQPFAYAAAAHPIIAPYGILPGAIVPVAAPAAAAEEEAAPAEE